jgi:hypothetical protein
MAYAFIEGLAGVVDRQKLFRQVTLSPRWAASQTREAQVHLHYPASDALFSYRYLLSGQALSLEIECRNSLVDFHVQLPAGVCAAKVVCNKKSTPFKNTRVQETPYVDFKGSFRGSGLVQICFA